jgi:hypothetical protein
MTLVKLPLPPEKSSYVYETAREVVSIKLDGGKSRKRKDLLNSASTVRCSWFLQPVEYQYFMAFYQSVTSRGATDFTIDLLLEQPYLEETTVCFISDSLSVKNIGLSFEVSCELEVKLQNDIDFAEIVVLLYDGKDGPLLFFNALEQLVNYDLDVA